MKAKPKAEPKAGRTLVDFVKAQRRSTCAVCQLSDDVRAQMRRAREKKISRPVVVEWLNKEVKAKVTSADIDVHVNGRHDDR